MATSWVSYRQPFGNSGRRGRSIMRAVSVPFSPARPSRLKNEPGIFPAAYMRSSTSTVSGRKSTSRTLPAVAVQRTIVSPDRTTTAPEACLAIRPVSREISVPEISAETRVTSAMRFLSCPSIDPDGPKRAFVASVGSSPILEDRCHDRPGHADRRGRSRRVSPRRHRGPARPQPPGGGVGQPGLRDRGGHAARPRGDPPGDRAAVRVLRGRRGRVDGTRARRSHPRHLTRPFARDGGRPRDRGPPVDDLHGARRAGPALRVVPHPRGGAFTGWAGGRGLV